MGRKIPAKKHRGVKDPLQQQAQRLQILKTKINAPPKDPDEQPVPRSLTELFSFCDKEAAKKAKKKKLAVSQAINREAKSNPVSELRKLPGESGRGFSLRINSAIRALHDSQDPQDYPQDLEEEDARGERMAALRERRQRKKKKKAGQGEKAPRLSHKDKLKEKRAAAALAAEAAQRERPQYERVPFGEVSAAPPALARPRGARLDAPRPGLRDLLLSKLLPTSRASGASVPSAVNAADRERRERARLDAVNAYRALKKQKQKK